jgi:hypothetical protein
MKKIAILLLLVPSFAYADVLPTRSLEPVIHIVDSTIYVTDKKGNDWAVVTNCQIERREVKEFTVRSKSLRAGTVVKLNDQKHCEIETIQAA